MSPSVTIPLSRPSLGEAEAAATRDVLLSGWVTQGPQVAAFEQEFASAVGAEHACAVSSGTAALHVALLALDIGPGDEVIVPSHSYIATANAVRHAGATPVFVDIDPRTLNMDPAAATAAVTGRTRALLPVHQLGVPCDLASLLALARARGLSVIEDAACAAGSEVLEAGRWVSVGRPHGTVACFSFHPRKVITTGEGGMLTTSDPALDRRFRQLRHHGMSISDLERHRSTAARQEVHEIVGYNYRMSDLQAAVGRVQLRRLPELVARRRAIAAIYDRELSGVPGLVTPESTYGRSYIS